jgi:hypothetical protein
MVEHEFGRNDEHCVDGRMFVSTFQWATAAFPNAIPSLFLLSYRI